MLGRYARLFVLFLGLVAGAAQAESEGARAPVVILVSIDGFRFDYLDRGVTPNLSGLAAHGVSAPMRPSFPTKTFPNHWAMVTGYRPDRSGIIGNVMEDPARPGEVFGLTTDDPFWWSAASPIWVDAEKAGIRTATMFWPGSNVGWGGVRTKAHGPVAGAVRPRDWQQFNAEVTATQRVDTVLDWLRRPASIRPRLVTLYFDSVDTAGHEFGPDDPRTTAAVAAADRSIGALLAGLRALRQPADVVVVSDHGMVATAKERVIPADTLADPALYRLVDSGPFAAFTPTPGNEERLAAALLRPRDHIRCWRKADIPAHLGYGRNPRVTPFFCLADLGWLILPAVPTDPVSAGSHGYDNSAPEMAALFVAGGPHFAPGVRLGEFDNVDIEPLLRDLLGLKPDADADGTDAPFRSVLRK